MARTQTWKRGSFAEEEIAKNLERSYQPKENRMVHRVLSNSVLLIVISQTLLLSQDARLKYPATRIVDVIDTYGSVKVPDPYRWLETIDSKTVADWVKAEDDVTLPYLSALPGRDAFKTRLTALYNYERTGIPFWEGGRWWYSKNSGL